MRSPVSLRCESLEGRDCPAARVFQFGGFLLVAGDARDNNVLINDLGNGRVAIVADNSFSVRTNVRVMVVATGGGDDTVTYNLFGGASAANQVLISTGAGNDTVTMNASALNDSLTLAVNTGGGDDDMSITLGGVPLNAQVNLFLASGAGFDDISVTTSGEVDGTLNLRANGGGGVDTLSGDLDLAGGTTGTVSAILAGSFGDDFLDLSVTGAGLGGAGLTAIINGGLGTDTGNSTGNVTQISIEQ